MAGLLGSVHCLAMCGGLSGALAYSTANQSANNGRKIFYYQLFYNLGRITTYIILGALMAVLGDFLAAALGNYGIKIIRHIAGLLIIGLGFYITKWWSGISKIEQIGAKLWNKIAPFMKKLLPVRTPLHAVGIGLLWGFLPCGLVYSTLSLATASTSPFYGAAIMAAFGIGTLPSMLATGVFAKQLSSFVRQEKVQVFSGIMIILMGLWTIIAIYIPHHLLMNHHH